MGFSDLPVAVLVLAGQLDRLLEGLGADHLQDGAEDLLVVGLHALLNAVEERGADEEALLIALQGEATPIGDPLRAPFDPPPSVRSII